MLTYKNAKCMAVACFAMLSLCLFVVSKAEAQTDAAPRFVAPSFSHADNTDPTAASEPIPIPSISSPSSQEKDENSSETNLEANAESESDDGSETAQIANASEPQKEPYDIYKENGVYFDGWEKPEVALVFTGMMSGYIEPCGCAGMDRMKGGLSRRHTFFKELRESLGWDVVAIDAGQLTVGFGVQEELKFDMAMNALTLMQYDAVGLGKGDLRFPAYFLLTFTAPTSATSSSLFTSANIGVYGFHPTYTLPYKIVERGGKRVSVVSVVCKDSALEQRDENILFDAPEKKLQEIAPKIQKEKCDVNVLIVHGEENEATLLAKKFPIFDYVLSSDSPSEPPAEAKEINGSQKMIEVGEKGKFAIVVGLYADGSSRYQRVALDSRYESSPEVTLLMKDYQSILKGLIVSKGFRDGLGVNAARSPQADVLGKYVGSQKCASCHDEAYRVWAKSKHASAWKSLVETANPPRDFDPECISCHVVGWDGLQHFPYVDGFNTEAKTPNLVNVGCESCHGPGERHVALEVGDDENAQERVRRAMRLGDSVKSACFSCHDGDNSPEFDFDVYYPLVKHVESDEE